MPAPTAASTPHITRKPWANRLRPSEPHGWLSNKGTVERFGDEFFAETESQPGWHRIPLDTAGETLRQLGPKRRVPPDPGSQRFSPRFRSVTVLHYSQWRFLLRWSFPKISDLLSPKCPQGVPEEGCVAIEYDGRVELGTSGISHLSSGCRQNVQGFSEMVSFDGL